MYNNEEVRNDNEEGHSLETVETSSAQYISHN